MRKMPLQARSRRRVDAILQATVKLMLELGYEATTTATIAAAAGVPIGSLYQFFDNKEAILETLAQRYATDMLTLRAQLFPADVNQLPLPDLVNRTADKLVTFMDEHRGFNHLFGSVWGSPEIAAASERMRADMIEGIMQVVTGRAPSLAREEVMLAAKTLLHIIQGILPLVEAGVGDDRVGAVRELKRAWLAYLRAVIEAAPRTQ